jgi:hypothetical protein
VTTSNAGCIGAEAAAGAGPEIRSRGLPRVTRDTRRLLRTCRVPPTGQDERIIREAMRYDEHTADVFRRALRLLDHEAWLARADAERLADEDLSGQTDAW